MFRFEFKDLVLSHLLDKADLGENKRYADHVHSFFELSLLVQGKVTYHIENESREVKPGEFVLILPGKYHYLEVDSKEDYERYVIYFPTDWVDESLKKRVIDLGSFLPFNPYISNIIKHVDAAMNIFEGKDFYLLCKCKMIEVLLFLINRKERLNFQSEDDLLQNTLNYIYVHIRECPSIQKIAKDLNYSPSYLQNEFKKKMKCPLMKYYNAKKIFIAQSMLRKGLKPHQVAKELGYANYSTFYRSYVKTLGFSPIEDPAISKFVTQEKLLQAK